MSEAPAPPAPEGVNRRSSATRLRLLQLALVVLALCAAAGGWWWNSTRDRQPATLIVGAGPLRSDSHELMREIAEAGPGASLAPAGGGGGVRGAGSTLSVGGERPAGSAGEAIARLNKLRRAFVSASQAAIDPESFNRVRA